MQNRCVLSGGGVGKQLTPYLFFLHNVTCDNQLSTTHYVLRQVPRGFLLSLLSFPMKTNRRGILFKRSRLTWCWGPGLVRYCLSGSESWAVQWKPQSISQTWWFTSFDANSWSRALRSDQKEEILDTRSWKEEAGWSSDIQREPPLLLQVVEVSWADASWILSSGGFPLMSNWSKSSGWTQNRLGRLYI